MSCGAANVVMPGASCEVEIGGEEALSLDVVHRPIGGVINVAAASCRGNVAL
jgi:hypothetical protein